MKIKTFYPIFGIKEDFINLLRRVDGVAAFLRVAERRSFRAAASDLCVPPCRRASALLRREGWTVNAKRVERIWRREGLKVPAKQPERGRLWLNDGSCIRLRPTHRGHVWSYDFVEDRTHEGRKDRMLNVIDGFTHEALAIRIDRKLNSTDVVDVLSDLFILRGVPENIRSDNVLCRDAFGA